MSRSNYVDRKFVFHKAANTCHFEGRSAGFHGALFAQHVRFTNNNVSIFILI